MSTKVIMKGVTLSYPHLHTPQPGKNGGKPKYSGAFIAPPGYNLSELQAAAIEAAEAKYPGKGAEFLRTGKLKTPFRTDAEAKGYPAGSVYINARSEQKPQCVYSCPDPKTPVGQKPKPAVIPDEKIREELYAGAQVNVSLAAFTYDTDGNRGVSFALNNVQKTGEGARLDGRKNAEDEFDADLSAKPADLESLI
jgi:hypothetical protein